MSIFGSYQDSIKALKDVIGGINAHSEASPYHAASNDKMIAGIECGISEIERREAAEEEAFAKAHAESHEEEVFIDLTADEDRVETVSGVPA